MRQQRPSLRGKKQPMHNPSPEELRAEIERVAYEKYSDRGAANGSDLDHWLEAEREVRARYGLPLAGSDQSSEGP